MTLTVASWWIPLLLTIFCLWQMLKPYRMQGDWDFGAIFRILWVVPISLTWVVHFALLYYFKE